MKTIDRKLLRDLWKIKGQALAISFVIASGVLMCVTFLSTFQSLRSTLDSYYDRQRFADVFASLKRAPDSLALRIVEIPGVAQLATRVVIDVTLDVRGMTEPATGRLLTLPKDDTELNNVFMREGRKPAPEHPDEVLLSEGFALAHGLSSGDEVSAVVNGRQRKLRIVGLALSPEFIYAIRPGELFPDDKRFGVLWMDGRALASAYDMQGGFNDLSVRLSRGASEPEVIAQVDRLLKPYGGLGAYPRRLQTSHWYLDSELAQLQTMGLIIPVIFLGVAAFLLNVVLTRIVAVQREQIAALKALGYSNRELVHHYMQWALAIALTGLGLGVLGGMWMGRGMTTLYNDVFRFPQLSFELSARVVIGAAVVSLGAALVGALAAVRRVVSLAPAEAMRPEPPAHYRASRIDGTRLGRALGPPTRMILRSVRRSPTRAVMTITGVACAVAMLIIGTFSLDSVDLLMDVQFNLAQRQDVTVSFIEPVSRAAVYELKSLPGVVDVEPMRTVAARLHSGHRSRQTAITGLIAEPRLNRIIDASQMPLRLPSEGLVLSAKLAEILAVTPGDNLTVEVLEGTRPILEVGVSAVVEEFMGTNVYMDASALHHLMREGDTLSAAFLQIDDAFTDALYARLKSLPKVAGVSLKKAAYDSFQDTLAKSLGTVIFFNILFAGVIAFGIVYNTAQISVSERSRELASLRVLGFTRGEISYILLGELGLVTAAALPLGVVLGYLFAAAVSTALDSELYRLPLVLSSRTMVSAVLVVAVASTLSALVVRRRLDHLDLVAVLKTKE